MIMQKTMLLALNVLWGTPMRSIEVEGQCSLFWLVKCSYEKLCRNKSGYVFARGINIRIKSDFTREQHCKDNDVLFPSTVTVSPSFDYYTISTKLFGRKTLEKVDTNFDLFWLCCKEICHVCNRCLFRQVRAAYTLHFWLWQTLFSNVYFFSFSSVL